MIFLENICILGCGYIGLPLAVFLADAGYKVIGVDVNKEKIKNLQNFDSFYTESGFEDMWKKERVRSNLQFSITPEKAEVFIIAVPTPLNESSKDADLSFVDAAVESILPIIKEGNLVILESTVPPFTCRAKIRDKIIEHYSKEFSDKIDIAHCPERVFPGNIVHEFINNDRIIGGLTEKSTLRAEKIYKSFVKGHILLTDDKTAEITKLSENTFRMINIAFANELDNICKKFQVDTNTVIELANHHPRVKILNPGIGSFDFTMPEEINRKIAGICSFVNFCPTKLSYENLIMEGIDPNSAFIVGNPIVDSVHYFLKNKEKFSNGVEKINEKLKLNNFYLMTLHRPGNVDDLELLQKILSVLSKSSLKILFLIHPRTMNNLKRNKLDYIIPKNITLNEPVGYFTFLTLLEKSNGIITDSGGIQEESVVLKKTCITLRPNTERPEAIKTGFVHLINPLNPDFENNLTRLLKSLEKDILFAEKQSDEDMFPFGIGDTCEKMFNIIQDLYKNDKLKIVVRQMEQNYFVNKLKSPNELNPEDEIQVSFNKDGRIITPNKEKSETNKVIVKQLLKYEEL